jgi:hypothetical protein
MNSTRIGLFFLSIIFLIVQVEAQNIKSGASITVKSPDGKIRADINVGTDSKLYYKISANGKEIIEPSRIGIVCDNIDMGSDIQF